MDGIWPAVVTLIPTIGIVYLFYMIMKYMLEGDRRERLAHAQWDAEQERLKAARGEMNPPDSQ